MNESFFKDQVRRLRQRFGDRAFDNEFVLLVWREVCTMSETGFARMCDVMIGSRTANKPPLLSEFREAVRNEEKIRFDNETRGAAKWQERPVSVGLKKLLWDKWRVETVKDAVELERLRLKKAQAESKGGSGPKGSGAA